MIFISRYFFVILISLLAMQLLALGMTARAETYTPKGSIILERDKPPKPATVKQIDEALAVTANCKAYEYNQTYYDCDCVGMKFLDLRQREGDKPTQQSLIVRAQGLCPNSAGAAGEVYKRCLSWGPIKIGQDYQEFCNCYGREYGNLYQSRPSNSIALRERQMTVALTKCQIGKINLDKYRNNSWIDKIKKQGLYETLFPGAVQDNEKPQTK